MKTLQDKQARTLRPKHEWRSKYVRRLRALDLAVVIWALAGAYGIRFGLADVDTSTKRDIDYVILA
ncbi:hypothetical protein, partial [Escherichia coli]|uniref:hypothetical protein n=1 Tax=Escherichia coli TaxID=562 RepID=UPI0032E3E81D